MLKRKLGSIAMGIVEIVIGILLLIDPVAFTSGIIIGSGVILMVAGVATVIRYFCTDAEEAAAGQILVKGLLMLLAGAFCAFRSHWFLITFPALSLVYGVVILIVGLTKIQWTVDMIRIKRGKWFWMAISAAISVLCAVTVMANPFSTTAVLWMFIGCSLIVDAVFDMVGAIFGNKDKPEPVAAEQEEA